MVNNNRYQILNKLKNSEQWLSGESISSEIGISRVAVWKQIKTLIDQGYPINSSSKGYRILEKSGNFSELEFGDDHEIIFYRELQSTMDEALRHIDRQKDSSRSFLILADHQSGGIARDKGVWDSPSGGIYLTFVLNQNMNREEVPLMKKRGLLTVLSTLASFQIPHLAYHPRGDIFIDGKKGAGILEEYHVRGGKVQWFALGLGLHINDQPADTERMTSVLIQSGITLDRTLVVKKLKERWERSLNMKSPEIKKSLDSYSLATEIHRASKKSE